MSMKTVKISDIIFFGIVAIVVGIGLGSWPVFLATGALGFIIVVARAFWIGANARKLQ